MFESTFIRLKRHLKSIGYGTIPGWTLNRLGGLGMRIPIGVFAGYIIGFFQWLYLFYWFLSVVVPISVVSK